MVLPGNIFGPFSPHVSSLSVRTHLSSCGSDGSRSNSLSDQHTCMSEFVENIFCRCTIWLHSWLLMWHVCTWVDVTFNFVTDRLRDNICGVWVITKKFRHLLICQIHLLYGLSPHCLRIRDFLVITSSHRQATQHKEAHSKQKKISRHGQNSNPRHTPC